MSFGFPGYQFFILWISVFLFYILRIPGYKDMSLSVFTFPEYEFSIPSFLVLWILNLSCVLISKKHKE